MFLLDTSICIYLMKNRYPALSAKVMSIAPAELAVSAVTVSELEYGAAKSRWSERTRQNLRIFLSAFQILPFTEEDALFAGNIRAALEAAGTPIGAYDVQIGAQGAARGLTVVTHNTGEFSRIPGIRLEDWTVG
jgi:tRNA(fMet)-specific endonuclease VapC